MHIERPASSEYDPYYESYIALVPSEELLPLMESQTATLAEVARRLPASGGLHSYAPDKWTVRQVFGHLVDAERLFGCRAYRISRRDPTPLPGFDENFFVENSTAKDTKVADIAREFGFARSSNLVFLSRLDRSRWLQMGTANNSGISVRALAYIMAGHVQHHLGILRDRYGVTIPS